MNSTIYETYTEVSPLFTRETGILDYSSLLLPVRLLQFHCLALFLRFTARPSRIPCFPFVILFLIGKYNKLLLFVVPIPIDIFNDPRDI